MIKANNKITKNIPAAIEFLNNGELVSFPTETVYGLGADARNPIAINKVFQAKGRPADHPLIVHIHDAEQLNFWAINIPPAAWTLAKYFWPGPLTLVLNKHPNVSELITGGQDTIALRVPNHPLALELLHRFGSGLVGPSANIYGHVSPTTAEHVAADLSNSVAAILDGGACDVGIESTIVCLTTTTPTIMRQGQISAEQISQVLGCDVIINIASNNIRVSGTHESHYAPSTPVNLIASNNLIIFLQKLNKPYSVISFQDKPIFVPDNIYWQKTSDNPQIYAHDLYANLRAHDQLNNDLIIIEQPPTNQAWAAINDRLTRASVKK